MDAEDAHKPLEPARAKRRLLRGVDAQRGYGGEADETKMVIKAHTVIDRKFDACHGENSARQWTTILEMCKAMRQGTTVKPAERSGAVEAISSTHSLEMREVGFDLNDQIATPNMCAAERHWICAGAQLHVDRMWAVLVVVL